METFLVRLLLRLWAVLVLAFLFIPIVLIVVYAFNRSTIESWPLSHLSTKWFPVAWQDPGFADRGVDGPRRSRMDRVPNRDVPLGSHRRGRRSSSGLRVVVRRGDRDALHGWRPRHPAALDPWCVEAGSAAPGGERGGVRGPRDHDPSDRCRSLAHRRTGTGRRAWPGKNRDLEVLTPSVLRWALLLRLSAGQ